MRLGVFCALLLAAAGRADDPKPATPAERYKALAKEQEEADAAFQKAYNAAGTDADRKRVADEFRPTAPAGAYADRVLKVVTDAPADFTAVHAAYWLMRNCSGSEQTRSAAEIAAREHAADPRLAGVFRSFIYYRPRDGAGLLRAAIDKSQDREVQGLARYVLGCVRKEQAERSAAAGNRPDQYAEFEGEAAALFREVAAKYADLKGQVEPLGVEADKLLFELEHLAVGKTAPELSGTDLDGKPFELSDFRGKVVLLHFWGSWCGPCVAEAPHYQKLLRLHSGRPFAVVGVAADTDRATAQAAAAKHGMPGPSLFDGKNGPAVTRWNVRMWPTLYLLDAAGVVRYKGDMLRTIGTRENSGGVVEQFWYLDDYVAGLLKELTDAPKP